MYLQTGGGGKGIRPNQQQHNQNQQGQHSQQVQGPPQQQQQQVQHHGLQYTNPQQAQLSLQTTSTYSQGHSQQQPQNPHSHPQPPQTQLSQQPIPYYAYQITQVPQQQLAPPPQQQPPQQTPHHQTTTLLSNGTVPNNNTQAIANIQTNGSNGNGSNQMLAHLNAANGAGSVTNMTMHQQQHMQQVGAVSMQHYNGNPTLLSAPLPPGAQFMAPTTYMQQFHPATAMTAANVQYTNNVGAAVNSMSVSSANGTAVNAAALYQTQQQVQQQQSQQQQQHQQQVHQHQAQQMHMQQAGYYTAAAPTSTQSQHQLHQMHPPGTHQIRGVLAVPSHPHQQAPPAYMLPANTLFTLPPPRPSPLLPNPHPQGNGGGGTVVQGPPQLLQPPPRNGGSAAYLTPAFCQPPLPMQTGIPPPTVQLSAAPQMGPSPLQTFAHYAAITGSGSSSSLSGSNSNTSNENVKQRKHAIPIINPLTMEDVLNPKPAKKSTAVEVKPNNLYEETTHVIQPLLLESVEQAVSVDDVKDQQQQHQRQSFDDSPHTTLINESKKSTPRNSIEKIDQQMQTDKAYASFAQQKGNGTATVASSTATTFAHTPTSAAVSTEIASAQNNHEQETSTDIGGLNVAMLNLKNLENNPGNEIKNRSVLEQLHEDPPQQQQQASKQQDAIIQDKEELKNNGNNVVVVGVSDALEHANPNAVTSNANEIKQINDKASTVCILKSPQQQQQLKQQSSVVIAGQQQQLQQQAKTALEKIEKKFIPNNTASNKNQINANEDKQQQQQQQQQQRGSGGSKYSTMSKDQQNQQHQSRRSPGTSSPLVPGQVQIVKRQNSNPNASNAVNNSNVLGNAASGSTTPPASTRFNPFAIPELPAAAAKASEKLRTWSFSSTNSNMNNNNANNSASNSNSHANTYNSVSVGASTASGGAGMTSASRQSQRSTPATSATSSAASTPTHQLHQNEKTNVSSGGAGAGAGGTNGNNNKKNARKNNKRDKRRKQQQQQPTPPTPQPQTNINRKDIIGSQQQQQQQQQNNINNSKVANNRSNSTSSITVNNNYAPPSGGAMTDVNNSLVSLREPQQATSGAVSVSGGCGAFNNNSNSSNTNNQNNRQQQYRQQTNNRNQNNNQNRQQQQLQQHQTPPVNLSQPPPCTPTRILTQADSKSGDEKTATITSQPPLIFTNTSIPPPPKPTKLANATTGGGTSDTQGKQTRNNDNPTSSSKQQSNDKSNAANAQQQKSGDISGNSVARTRQISLALSDNSLTSSVDNDDRSTNAPTPERSGGAGIIRYTLAELKQLSKSKDSRKPPLVPCQKGDCISQLFVSRQHHHGHHMYQQGGGGQMQLPSHMQQQYQSMNFGDTIEFQGNKQRRHHNKKNHHDHYQGNSGGSVRDNSGGGGTNAHAVGSGCSVNSGNAGNSGAGNLQFQRKMDIIHVNLSLKEEIKLSECENAWMPHQLRSRSSSATTPNNDDLEAVLKKVRGVLNKLTPDNFDVLLKTMTSISINTQEKMQQVMLLIFEKTVSEPNFAPTYAKFCKVLFHEIKLESKALFSNLLITRIQHEFETNVNDADAKKTKLQPLVDRLSSCSDVKERQELQAELEDQEYQFRRRAWGTVRFIGEMYKLQSLTNDRVFLCIESLLEHGCEEKLEYMCKLLTTVGHLLEGTTDQLHFNPRMDKIFRKIQDIVNKSRTGNTASSTGKSNNNNQSNKIKLSSRVRFMMQDVIDLRSRRWDQSGQQQQQQQQQQQAQQYQQQNQNQNQQQQSQSGHHQHHRRTTSASSSRQDDQQQHHHSHRNRGNRDNSNNDNVGGYDKNQNRLGGFNNQGGSGGSSRQMRHSSQARDHNSYFMQKQQKSSGNYHNNQHQQQQDQKVNIDVNKLNFSRSDEVSTGGTKLGNSSIYLWRTDDTRQYSGGIAPSIDTNTTLTKTVSNFASNPFSSLSNSSSHSPNTNSTSSNSHGASRRSKQSNLERPPPAVSPPEVSSTSASSVTSPTSSVCSETSSMSQRECQQVLNRLIEEVLDSSNWYDEALNTWSDFSFKQQVALLHYLLMNHLHLSNVKQLQRKACANIFAYLMRTNAFEKSVFTQAYKRFAEEFADLLVDVPNGWTYVFEFLGPILHERLLHFNDIWYPQWNDDSYFTERFLKAMIVHFTTEFGMNYMRDLWHKEYKLGRGQQFLSGLPEFREFLNSNNFNYIERNYATGSSDQAVGVDSGVTQAARPAFQHQRRCSPVEQVERIGFLLNSGNDCDMAIDYINTNVQMNMEFLRVLTKFLCCDYATYFHKRVANAGMDATASDNGNEVGNRQLNVQIFRNKCMPLLRLSIDTNETHELECLDQIVESLTQAYDESTSINLICSIFEVLYDCEVISKDTFEKWYNGRKGATSSGLVALTEELQVFIDKL